MRKSFLFLTLLLLTTASYADTPETVISIDRPKPGKEQELLNAIREHRATQLRLGLITGPHHLFRAEDDAGRPMYVEIFTWKGHDIPDHAPPEIRKVWDKMNAAVETRDGRQGIEFYEITPVSEESSPPAAVPSK
jgi:hypothetical protein